MQRTAWLFFGCFLAVGCGAPYQQIPLAPPVVYTSAEAALLRGDHATAIVDFRSFLKQTSDPTYRVRAYYQLAQAYYRSGDAQATLSTLMDLEDEFPMQRWVQVETLRGDARDALGDRTEAMLAWEDAWDRGSPAEREILHRRMNSALDELNDKELRELYYSLTSVPAVREMIRPHVSKEPAAEKVQVAAADVSVPQAGEFTVEESEKSAAEEAPATKGAAEKETAAHAEETEAGQEVAPAAKPEALGGKIEPRTLEPEQAVEETAAAAPSPRIACLLPLTGPDGAYGRRALGGLRFAFRDAPEKLLVRDSGADPVLAVKLINELAADPSVLAVIGPLRNSEAEVVAPRAKRLKLPVVLLSHREGMGNDYVLQTSVTRQQQVESVVEYAAQTLGAKNFAILYPDDGYGRGFKTLFRRAVKGAEGHIAGQQAYVPGQPDFKALLKTARRWSRRGNLDAVFIPDAAFVAAPIGAALHSEMPDIALLGTESWNRPEMLAQLGTEIDGAVFADTFFRGSDRPAAQSFVKGFEAEAGHPPTAFEAQAFDAGTLVRRAMDEGAATRNDILTALRAMEPYDGPVRLRVTQRGFEPELFLLRVRNGRIEQILAAGQG